MSNASIRLKPVEHEQLVPFCMVIFIAVGGVGCRIGSGMGIRIRYVKGTFIDSVALHRWNSEVLPVEPPKPCASALVRQMCLYRATELWPEMQGRLLSTLFS